MDDFFSGPVLGAVVFFILFGVMLFWWNQKDKMP